MRTVRGWTALSRLGGPRLALVAAIGAFVASVGDARAGLIVTVDATAPIFVAGRTDFVPAPPGLAPPGYLLVRSPSPGPGPNPETLPPFLPAAGGDQFQFAASGLVNYNILTAGPIVGPDGDTVFGANISSLGGISGYVGPAGPLSGVFLDAAVPSSGPAPPTLDFTTGGSRSFDTLSPVLGQVFFIGDGLTGTGTGVRQTFVAPVGATRLFLGLADARFFTGAPGSYDDNAGAFAVVAVPEPGSLTLFGIGIVIMMGYACKWRCTSYKPNRFMAPPP